MAKDFDSMDMLGNSSIDLFTVSALQSPPPAPDGIAHIHKWAELVLLDSDRHERC